MAPENLNQAIIEFLSSATAAKRLACDSCGATQEYRRTTFLYDGTTWEVELPVCLKCNPLSGVTPHDA
jgi:hypothetical protein